MIIDRKWLISKIMILILFLASPVIESLILKRQDRYRIYGRVDHKIGYIEKKIFKNKRPIDFLFLGPSGTWTSVNARLLENRLRSKFGKKIIVQNFGHIFIGLDLDYIILSDLIQQREVKNLFLGMPAIRQKELHRAVRSLWDPFLHSADMESDLFIRTYSDKLLESFPSLIKQFRDPHYRFFVPFENYNGAFVLKKGFSTLESSIDHKAPFTPNPRAPLSLRLSEIVFQSDEAKDFGQYTEYQEYYLKKIVELCREKKINLYFLATPAIAPDEDASKINKLSSKNDLNVPYFGVPMARLFPGEDFNKVKEFFYNSRHTNANGANYFSASILPALEEIYESQNH